VSLRINAVVFDKTGTLTSAGAGDVRWIGAGDAPMSNAEGAAIRAIAVQSTHPLARRVADALVSVRFARVAVTGFREVTGGGVEGMVGREVFRLGSPAWLRLDGSEIPEVTQPGSRVAVAVGGVYRGEFSVGGDVRAETGSLLKSLNGRYVLALLSGDNERERERFTALFGAGARLHFNQTPLQKLAFIRGLQESGRRVLMAGDGLNDAGALRQADVGVAVTEDVASFSPASDVIIHSGEVARLGAVLDFSRRVVRVVRITFLVSTAYNLVGLAIAASGRLSPIVCAVLMPLSSVSVVVVACALTEWVARRAGVTGRTISSTAVHSMPMEAK